MGKIRAPEPITSAHDLSQFDCGVASLNDWLKKRALKNQDIYSATNVVCINKQVIAYYTLAYGSVNHEEVTRKIRRNAPDKIPVMILCRLAVDKNWQTKGLGKHLLKQVFLKTIDASAIAGLRGLLVHAIDENAKAFYQHYGFLECPVDLALLLPLEDIVGQL
jgi:GNAT superfamily N-acetyltransferase